MALRSIITRIELLGGPEDGRILERADWPMMVTVADAPSTGKIPLVIALDDPPTLEEGDEIELLILGYYGFCRVAGDCAKFEWFPLP
jgi:hypothetical protein